MTNTIDYRLLAQEMIRQVGANQAAFKQVSSSPTPYYAHGNGGLFSAPGMSKPLISAMVLPYLGLMSKLPAARPSQESSPLYGIITGVTATTGAEPIGVCDDPPTAGLMKLCTHSAPFGRFSRQTRVFDLDRIGLITNRGEFTDLELWGGPNGTSPWVPSAAGADASMRNAISSEIGKALFELAVAWSRDFADVLFSGNTSANTAGGGYKEFYGLDVLINTGRRDAETGSLCPAADSDVRTMANANVSTDSVAMAKLTATLIDMWRAAMSNASRMGLAPVRWAWVMRRTLFQVIADYWPCAYMTSRCNVGTGAVLNLDAADVTRMREDMLGDLNNATGQYLSIDGVKIEVIVDDSIPETSMGGGAFSSPIYLVPLTVLGSRPVTYMEYLPYDGAGGPMAAANVFAADGMFYTSDGGRFFWHRKVPNNFCVQLMVKTEPRLLLLTPQIAGKITSIAYTPTSHERSWDPSSPNYVNGGHTDRIGRGPSYFPPA